jgi:DNA repair exonuclease SbcCD ATPase subunit
VGYRIKRIVLENFVVFVDRTEIDFATQDINQIDAVFKNNEKQSNGAGKSVIICAISMALFGKGLRFNYLSDYIAPTNPGGGIYVGLELEDSKGNTLKVERWRRPNSDTNKAKLWLNGAHISKDSTVSKVDELVASYIGVSHSNFLSCVFSVELRGFLKLRPAERFEILENALAVKKMDSIIKKLNSALRLSEDKLINLNNVLSDKMQSYGHELAKQEIFSANSDSVFSAIKKQETELAKFYAEEVTLQTKKDSLISLLSEVKEKLDSKQELYQNCLLKIKAHDNNIAKLKSKVSTVAMALKSNTMGELECLVCQSKLDVGSEDSIRTHYETEIAQVQAHITQAQPQKRLLEASILKLKNTKESVESKISGINDDLRICNSSAIACEKTIAMSKKNLEASKSNVNEQLIAALKKETESLSEQRTGLIKDSKIITGWKQAMSKNGLRLAYLREEVSTLSAIASKYASSVYGKPTKVEFSIDQEKDNPQLIMTVNGKYIEGFSTGEKRLLEVAMTLSLLTLLKTAGMNLDFLILDEATDGLSIASKTQLLSVIKELANNHQIIAISHDELIKKSLSGNLITVIKDDATSRSTIEQSINTNV